MWKTITGFIKFLYDGIAGLIRVIIDAIKSLPRLFKRAGAFISDAAGTVISFVREACSQAKDLFTSISEGIKTIYEDPKILLWLAAAGLAASALYFCPSITESI